MTSKFRQFERAREIFHSAIDIAGDRERSAYVQKACGADETLQEVVTEFLRAHVNPTGILDGEVATIQPRRSGTESSLFLEPGSSIGPYRILQKIGEGGCGVVYSAEQRSPFSRRVAIKVIKPGLDSQEFIRRFEREREAMAMMDHPNIAQVFDAGTTDAGRPFLVMELLSGEAITSFCDRLQLSNEARIEIFRRICHAVHHAHQKGVIHRDLKPSNVLVVESNGELIPKIIDFGIAKAIDNAADGDTALTRFQQFLGTPAYTSPEQASLESRGSDTRSDIYSLGALLYELLTGRPPFDSEDFLEVGIEAIRRRIVEGEPSRPSQVVASMSQEAVSKAAKCRGAELVQFIEGIPRELDWIILKALEKDRAQRYESCDALALDLERFLNQEPVAAAAPSSWYRLQKFARRHRVAVTTGAVAAVLLIASTAVAALFASWAVRARFRESEARMEAEAHFRHAQRAQYVSDIKAAQVYLEDDNLQVVRDLLRAHFPRRTSLPDTDLRGVEWFYLWEKAQGDQIRELEGHRRHIRGIGFSPDGSLLVSTADDQTVKLWDWRAGIQRASFDVPGIHYLPQFSADGKTFAAKSGGTIRFWNREGSDISYWKALELDEFWHFRFSPTEHLLAARYPNGSVDIYPILDDIPLKRIPTSGTAVGFGSNIAFSQDGQFIANFSTIDSLEILRTDSYSRVAHVSHSSGMVAPGLLFSPDGERLLITELRRPIYDWDWRRSSSVRKINSLSERNILGVAYSPGGEFLATAETDHQVYLWDGETFELLRQYRGHENEVVQVAFSPDGSRIASGGQDGKILVWDPRKQNRSNHIEGPHLTYENVCFSPDGRHLALASGEFGERASSTDPSAYFLKRRGVEIYDFENGKRWLLSKPDQCLGFSADGLSFYSCRSESTTRDRLLAGEWDVSHLDRYDLDGELLSQIALKGEYGVSSVQGYSATLSMLALGGMDGRISLFDAESGIQSESWSAHNQPVYFVRFSPDGRWLASGQYTVGGPSRLAGKESSLVKLWDIGERKEGHLHYELKHRDRLAKTVAFSPDSRTLAIGGFDGSITVWDLNSGRQTQVLKGHKAGVSSVCFSPDGNTLISGGEHQLYFWNLDLGRELLSIPVEASVSVVSCASDGRRMAYQISSTGGYGHSDRCVLLEY